MSFKLTDVAVESVLRDAFGAARRDPEIVQDIFCDLTRPFASKKYGQKEIDKIQSIIENREVSIVHAYGLTNSNMPCISIQLIEDVEEEAKTPMGGFQNVRTRTITDPDKLAALIQVPPFQPDSYDPLTGVVRIPDSVNLSAVYANLVFVDADGASYTVRGGIVNYPGVKQLIIEPGIVALSLADGAYIKSSLDYEVYTIRGNAEKTSLMLGIHTSEPLLTKYLYTFVKHAILSRRRDLVSRGYQLNTYSGSDFHRNSDYPADVVFSRFLNISGIVMHSWRSDKVQLIDQILVDARIPKDRLGNVALGRTDQTIKVEGDD